MQLGGLSEFEQIEKLLKAELDVGSISEDVTSFILEKSNGNPLWAKEFVKAMCEEELVTIDEPSPDRPRRHAHKTDERELTSWKAPESVETLITSRIDKLKPRMQQLMKVASVISDGNSFSTEMLRTVVAVAQLEGAVGDTIASMQSVLSQLCKADFMTLEHESRSRLDDAKHSA